MGLAEAFALYDKRSEGTVSIKEIGNLLRAIGRNPTKATLLSLEKMARIDNMISENDTITLASMEQLVANHPFDETGYEERILETFKEYDKDNTGKITVEELRKLLMSGSDGLTEDEADEIIGELDVDNEDSVDYEAVVSMMLE